MMDPVRSRELGTLAKEVRKDVVRMIGLSKVGCLGVSLALVDLLVFLYWELMRVDPADARMAERDRLVLSKWRGSPALYSVLARRGFFSREELWSFGRLGALLQGSPDCRRVPGVDAPSGPSGMGLGMAVGLSIALRMDGLPSRVFCLMGDGELRDGLSWEAAFSASFHRLDRLVAVINVTDHGGEPWGPADDPESMGRKLATFGWAVSQGDGHDFPSMETALAQVMGANAPKAVILRTLEGGGVPLPRGGDALSRGDVDSVIGQIEYEGRGPLDDRT